MLNTAKFEKLNIKEVEKLVEKIIKKLNIYKLYFSYLVKRFYLQF